MVITPTEKEKEKSVYLDDEANKLVDEYHLRTGITKKRIVCDAIKYFFRSMGSEKQEFYGVVRNSDEKYNGENSLKEGDTQLPTTNKNDDGK